MPKYIIERDMPGLGTLTPEQLRGASQKSCSVLTKLGPQIQWLESFVTENKLYCVYIAPDEAIVREQDTFEAGIPESFNVLVKEMRSLGLNVELTSTLKPIAELPPSEAAE